MFGITTIANSKLWLSKLEGEAYGKQWHYLDRHYFDWAVIALYQVAGLIGITYEQINVWLVYVDWPFVNLVLAHVALSLFRQNLVSGEKFVRKKSIFKFICFDLFT